MSFVDVVIIIFAASVFVFGIAFQVIKNRKAKENGTSPCSGCSGCSFSKKDKK